MTRDEAIEAEVAFVRRDSRALGTDDRVGEALVRELAEINVDRYVRFGMLKLDEPTLKEKFKWATDDVLTVVEQDGIWRAIHNRGLKIVEK